MNKLTIWELRSKGDVFPVSLPSVPDSLDDVSRQLPQGVYSTFRTFGNCTRVMDLKYHLERLYKPAIEMGILPAVSPADLRQALEGLLEAYQPDEARVRISLALSESLGKVFAAIEPLKVLSDEVYQRGVRVVTSHVERAQPRLKSTAFIQSSAQERKSILKDGIFEGLMLNNGRILEGLTSNFYAVRNGRLITARKGILLGVTRRLVLRLARRAGVVIEYRPLDVSELPTIDEAFITSSSRGVVPVVEIDGHAVGQGLPGNLTKMLGQVYNEYVQEKAEKI